MGPEDNGTTAIEADGVLDANAPQGSAVGTDQALEVRGLRKTYESEGVPVRALRGVDFDMEAGEFVAVMGPSGSGKSTLLHLIGGLDAPTSGRVRVGGDDLGALDDDRLTLLRRRRIGFIFQAFNLIDVLTVLAAAG